jgi:hypothetical protein
MTNESRILTVSYGTFSCTLEGFDDPFNTMKAIAEYFRDLAAEDRYFGAEPLQPDAAMMHRVADREVSRLVGAKAREAGLVLRKSDVDAAEDRITGRVRPSEDTPAPAPEPIPEPPVVEPVLQAAMPTGVVAKLARIREAVSRPLDDSIAPPALPEDVLNAFREEVEEPAAAPAMESPAAWTGFAKEPQADTARSIDALLQDPEADAAAEVADDNIFADLAASEPVADAAPAAMPDAASEAPFIEVDDLEAEVLRTETFEPVQLAPAMPAPELAEPEALADMAADEVQFDDPLADEILAYEDAAVDRYEDDVAEAVESLAAATEVEVEPEYMVEAADAVAYDTPEAKPETATDDIVEDVAPAMPVDLMADDTVEDAPGDVMADTLAAEDLTLEDLSAEDADEIDAPLPTAANRTQRVSSRIVRIHAEDDAATAAPTRAATRMVSPDEAEDLARLMRQADDVMADEENRRRLEALAHLKAAVVATEADRAAGEAMRAPGAPDDEPYREDLSQVVLPDTEEDPSEVRPRRKTVSVRPQEPRPGTIRPGMVSPPPLVLVSEQRVDRIMPTPEVAPVAAPAARAPAALPTGPNQPGIEGQPMIAVRTGRLTGAIGVGAAAATPLMQTERVILNRASPAAAMEMDEDDGPDEHLTAHVEAGLASFAERVGVKSLAEMLEAAAAYATCVERREQFTRPQLMRRLMASAGGKPVSREDGLRSFGTLLRTGRIEKVGRGHYILAEHSPYLTEARRFR